MLKIKVQDHGLQIQIINKYAHAYSPISVLLFALWAPPLLVLQLPLHKELCVEVAGTH